MVRPGTVWRGWVGTGVRTIATIALWRVASMAVGLGLVAPIMKVGRRPYRIGRLVDRLDAVKDMTIIPDSLPTQLSWFAVVLGLTAAGGLLTPAPLRRAHGVVAAVALVLAVTVYRTAGRSDITSVTTQLVVVIVLLVIAVFAAAVPTGQPDRR